MHKADHTNFVSVISEEKPVMIFFHKLSDPNQTEKIKELIADIQKKLPLLPAYEYIIDENKQNQELANTLEISKTPILLFFKNGNFHRFKNKTFTKPSIESFIGFKKPYQKPPVEKDSIDVDMDETSETKTVKKETKIPKAKKVVAKKVATKKIKP